MEINLGALEGYLRRAMPGLLSGPAELKATKIDGGQVRSEPCGRLRKVLRPPGLLGKPHG